MREARLPADLPERFALLYNCDNGKFDTPLDPMGIADVDEVFELAIWTYPDELPPFSGGERNKHHLYWSEEWWKQYAERHPPPDRKTILEFRDSPPQKAYVPIPIHAWIEEIMVPPPPPSIDVMRRRNTAWRSANLLLQEAMRVEEARENYVTKKDKPRRMLGHIEGLTPKSRRREKQYVKVVDNEYLLSELNDRLDSWRSLAAQPHGLAPEDRIVILPRLADVRALNRRIRKGAIVPRVPASLLVA